MSCARAVKYLDNSCQQLIRLTSTSTSCSALHDVAEKQTVKTELAVSSQSLLSLSLGCVLVDAGLFSLDHASLSSITTCSEKLRTAVLACRI